jgi:alpha-D-xyloside xylohydrolase
MRLPAAICTLLLAVLLTAARADRATWSSSAPGPAGGWIWKTADGAQTFVTVEGAPEGALKVTLSPKPPTGSPPAAPGPPVQVTAGAVTLKGLPPLTFGLQPGMARCALPAAPNEAFFGLGEKFNAVNQRGRQVNMWVDDGYRSLGDKTYLPVPMVVSSGGWGLYLDSTFRSVFDLASDGHTVVITHYAPQMTVYLWRADSARELLHQYCKITGLPEAPPDWAFGIWLSRSSYSTQQEVLEVARRWRALDLPLSLFNVEGWKGRTYHTFNEATFPDPRAMIQELHSYGWKVMLWNTHNIPPTDPDYKMGDSRGYFAKGADGKTFSLQDGYGSGGCLDVTNPEAVRWWNSLYDPLLDMGVDALFNDVTNYLDDDFGSQRCGRMHFSDGRTTEEMHNRYWMIFNQVTYEYMKRKTGNDTVLRVAGGWAGQQKYSTTWAGDSLCRWEFLRRDITAVLSAGWSGLPYAGYDIPGYADAGNPVSPELYMRWLEFGSLSPMMEFHSTARTEPWYYGDEAIKALRN